MYYIENDQSKVEFTKELEEAIKSVCDRVLEDENVTLPCEISITIVDNEQIHEINLEHRGIDRPTDVLSFPMLEFETPGIIDENEIDFDEDELVLGDIVISLERASEQAESYGHSLLREVAFLTAHSMLHLLGYDHMEPEEEAVMISKQEKSLTELGITREN